MLIKIIPYVTTVAAVWFVFIGMMHSRRADPTHGLMYQLSGVLIAAMTALAVWIKN